MHKRLLLLFILVASILLILTNFYTIKVFSAVRGYINAESQYSKGQKDAVIFLLTYLQTESPVHIQAFKEAILIPIGDNLARTNLTSNGEQAITEKWFLKGKNDIANLGDMQWLFETFHSVKFMQKAIGIWAEGDPWINKLDTLGQHIYDLQKEGKLTPATKLQYIKTISLITTHLAENEIAFSHVLDKAARDIKLFLQWANILFILFILLLTALFAFRMMDSLSASEKTLKATIIELNDANKELEHFSHIASHDLKEPLRMVTSFLSLLQKKCVDKLDETDQSYIKFAIDGAKRMKKLIDELLEYSKTSITKLVYENIDVNEVIKEVKINFQDVFTEPAAGLFIEVLPQIKANRMQMEQLFQNLIGNAIKYRSEAAPEICINATENKTHCIFAVKDNGLGVEPEFFNKIFVIFNRLHTDATHSGSGIGLAICKKIVERHGGKIWLESKPGLGSTFFFSIAKQLPPIS